jgi:hypothetical protein
VQSLELWWLQFQPHHDVTTTTITITEMSITITAVANLVLPGTTV